MNITTEKVGPLDSIIKVNIVEDDYRENVNNTLKEHRKNAEIKGFRKGMVPFGLIKKMIGKSVLGEEINKIVSKELMNFLSEENIQVLGEPLPSLKEQKPIDWDNQAEFEFAFDIGLMPEFELNLSVEEDTIPYYQIAVSDKMISDTIESYKQQYGQMQDQEIVTEESGITADLQELTEDGNVKEDGIHVEDASILIKTIKDEEIKNSLIAANKQQIFTIDLKKALPNDTEIASLLKIEKEQAATIDSNFQLTIKNISVFVPAEINQELFDKIFGEGEITTEEAFRDTVKGTISRNLVHESDYKFQLATKEYILNKLHFDLPEAFLKRWLVSANKDLDQEQIEQEWPGFEKDLKWQLITSKLAKEKDLSVTEDDVKDMAIQIAKAQFQQYGIANLPDEQAEMFAKKLLEDQDQRNKIENRKLEEKVFTALKGMVKRDTKEISHEDFGKLFEPKPEIETKELNVDDDSNKGKSSESEKEA